MKKLTEKIYIFFRMLDLILDAIKSVLFQIAIGFIIIISIIKFVDTTWLRWLLLVMSGGALFYSVYDDLVLYLRKEFIKTLSKEKKIVTPTLKEGIWNWAKAIFWVCLCVGVWFYYFDHKENKHKLISEEKYIDKIEDYPCLKGNKLGELIPNPDYVGPEVKCE